MIAYGPPLPAGIGRSKDMSRPMITIFIRRTSSISNENDVLLGDSTIRKLNVPTDKPIMLRFGSSKTIIKISPHSKNKHLYLSGSLATKLSLHHGTKLHMHYDPVMNQLYLGPLIAVLMSKYHKQSSQPFASNTTFCKELAEAGQLQGAFVYFLTPKQINTSNPVVEGWMYNQKWKKMSFPYPDVMYNRLSRKLEKSTSVKKIFTNLKNNHQTSIFNEKFLNKAEVFRALARDKSLQQYLPETDAVRNYQSMKKMCNKYATVFLKPVSGSLGKGIIKITRQKNATYICHFSSVNGTRKVSYASLTKVFQAISGKLKAQHYQIQQGLDLITNNGRPIDFRALVQKSINGQWKITSIVARIASSQHFVSNLARGGQLSGIKATLAKTKIIGVKKSKLQTNLRKAALKIAQGVDAQVQEHFGELGIDLAVDKKGKIWLLEVNSKPSKSEDTSVTPNKIRPSAIQIIQYARYLTGL